MQDVYPLIQQNGLKLPKLATKKGVELDLDGSRYSGSTDLGLWHGLLLKSPIGDTARSRMGWIEPLRSNRFTQPWHEQRWA